MASPLMVSIAVRVASPVASLADKSTNSSVSFSFDHFVAFFSVQCQLFALVPSSRSSTIHRGSPSPHLA